MSTLEKFIYTVAGTVLSMLIIAIAFILLKGNREASEAVSNQDERLSNKVMQTQWACYHGTEVEGAEVAGVIERFTEDGLYVTVKTRVGENTYTTGSTAEVMGIRNSDSNKYIDPKMRFTGQLILDPVTEAVCGIRLVPAA